MTTRVHKGLIIILLLSAISLILSQSATPDAVWLFGLKRIQERAFLNTESTPVSQVNYMSSLLELRLRELQSLVNNKKYDYVLPSASRYSTLAGQITDLIVENNLTDEAENAKRQFLSHRKTLDEIYVIYPKNTDNVEYKYIQDDYNYLNLYLDKLEQVK